MFRLLSALIFVDPLLLLVEDDRVARFTHYFEETWLNDQYHTSVCLQGPRTNNHVEGWHNRLAGKSHPNIYEVVDSFKTEQAATEVTLRQLEAGGVLAQTRKAYRTKEKRLKTIQQKFTNDKYSLEQYVTALSYCVRFRS